MLQDCSKELPREVACKYAWGVSENLKQVLNKLAQTYLMEAWSRHESTIFLVGAAEKAAYKSGGAQVNQRGRPRTDLGLLLDTLSNRLRNAGP